MDEQEKTFLKETVPGLFAYMTRVLSGKEDPASGTLATEAMSMAQTTKHVSLMVGKIIVFAKSAVIQETAQRRKAAYLDLHSTAEKTEQVCVDLYAKLEELRKALTEGIPNGGLSKRLIQSPMIDSIGARQKTLELYSKISAAEKVASTTQPNEVTVRITAIVEEYLPIITAREQESANDSIMTRLRKRLVG